ncbi:hypothetical protein MNAN1_002450 [Malassezia nana]|uniref:Uncharacterized protein n=1 Tax=Malassezia nana TaxID=180528 RepID=A0AAF0EN30_9BASI|nr:hypothetical protein MNAN1_002450 [Malassezia nana]
MELPMGGTNLLPSPNPLETSNKNHGYMDMNAQNPTNGMKMSAPASLAPGMPQSELAMGLGVAPTINMNSNGAPQNAIKSPDPSTHPFLSLDLHQNAHLNLSHTDALASVPHDLTPVESVSMQNTFGGSVLSDPSNALHEIGTIIDELASTAADARVHFHGGQFDKCSEKVESLKKMIKRIGEIGVMSINHASEQHSCSSSNGPGVGSPVSPDHKKQLFSAALFSVAADGHETKKRRIMANQMPELPMKALRGPSLATRARSRSDLSDIPLRLSHLENKWPASTLVSPTFQSNPFDFQMSPACPGQNQPTRSSTFSFSETSNSQPVLSSTPSENVIPVVLEQAQVIPPAVSLPASPPSAVPSAKTMSSLAQITEEHSDVNVLPSSSMALKLALEQPSSDSWHSDRNGQVLSSHNDSIDNSNASFLDSADDGWEGFSTMDRAAGGATELSAELRVLYDKIFHDFLNCLCSNLEAKDERGELIHQTLMPKKMARLDESPDFRPFKFRIQAFTNAFQAELQRQGLGEEDSSMRKVKPYLWTHPYISRFNEDGKKAKSKGNHIWNVEARRLPGGGWEFFTFTPKIAGAASKVAYVGEPWSWNLRIWDPQASSSNIKVVYSANTLPRWLHWEEDENVLTGIPQDPTDSCEVSVTALYVQFGQLHRLEHSFFLKVLPSNVESRSNGEMPSTISDVPPTQQAVEMRASQTAPAPALAMGMSGPQFEMQKHEVVEPSHASDVLSSIPFPFTPPVYMDKAPGPFQFDPSLLHRQQPSTPAPSSAFAGSATRPQTVVFINNTGSHGVATPMPSTTNVHTSPTAPMPVAVSSESAVSSVPHVMQGAEPSSMIQMWNEIERRQQEQASSLMLLMPQRPQAFSLNEHPGQSTPMSNMPSDISASLPSLNPNPSN